MAYGFDFYDGLDCLVIDTWAQVMKGGNENSSEDAGAVLSNCDFLHKKTGATIIAVMHTPISDTGRARGWSGVLGAADTSIVVDHDSTKGHRSWRIAKQKDGPTTGPHPFKLAHVSLGLDDQGDEISSCYVEPGGELPEKGAKKPKLHKASKYLELVCSVLPANAAIPIAELQARVCALLPGEAPATIGKGIRRLVAKGNLASNDDGKTVQRNEPQPVREAEWEVPT